MRTETLIISWWKYNKIIHSKNKKWISKSLRKCRKSLWNSWSKWLKDIKTESEKAVKTIWWLNTKLKSLNDELNQTQIWSKRFKELQMKSKKLKLNLVKFQIIHQN